MKSSLKVKDKEILEKSENEEVAKEKTVKLYVRSLETNFANVRRFYSFAQRKAVTLISFIRALAEFFGTYLFMNNS